MAVVATVTVPSVPFPEGAVVQPAWVVGDPCPGTESKSKRTVAGEEKVQAEAMSEKLRSFVLVM